MRGTRERNSLDAGHAEGDPLLHGLWACANAVLGSSVNRKTLAALRHAPLPQSDPEMTKLQPTSKP